MHQNNYPAWSADVVPGSTTAAITPLLDHEAQVASTDPDILYKTVQGQFTSKRRLLLLNTGNQGASQIEPS